MKSMLIIALSIIISSCSGMDARPNMPAPQNSSQSTMSIKEYRIGVDDQLKINVWRNPELSLTVPVRPDGNITMPLIGDVKAGGKTPKEVSAHIQKKLSEYVRNPNVSVILTELRNFEYISRIRVTGAVQTPTSFPYRQGMTVLDAVLQSGGVNEFAAADRSKLYRQVKGKTEIYNIYLDGILNQGKLSTNYPLKPGDIITVPERFF